MLCVLSDSLSAISLHRSCSTQLPLLFHHNKQVKIHEAPSSPELWHIQFISDHFPHLTFLTRNDPTPNPSRIVVVSFTFLVNGLGPPRLHFRPHGAHRLWQEVLFLSYSLVLKAMQTIKTSWGGMPHKMYSFISQHDSPMLIQRRKRKSFKAKQPWGLHI